VGFLIGEMDMSVDSKFDSNEELVSLKKLPGKPLVVSRDNHTVSRRNIDQDAMKVLNRLNGHGYQAFLVGGGVRDLLLGKAPKDFDIGTSASPDEIRDLFRNSRIIGRRFKLVHVYFKGGKIIEVSTFRAATDASAPETLAQDNTYGDAESDALRRDLSINGLFYDAADFTVVDYVGGLVDLEDRVVRIIGDPDVRFTEDPVRIIRAARHAARADFSIEKETSLGMKRHVGLIEKVPSSRLYEEVLKDFYSGAFRKTFVRLRSYGVINQILPSLENALQDKSNEDIDLFLDRLDVLDALISQGKDPLTEIFFTCLLIGNVSSEFGVNDELPSNSNFDEWDDIQKFEYLSQEKFHQNSDDENSKQESSEITTSKDYFTFKLKPFKKDRNNRDRISNFAKVIGDWFAPLTLTKREKTAIERLLIIRHRVLTAKSTDIPAVSELLNSLHLEERENVKLLCEIFNSEVPRGLRGVLGGQSHRRRKRPWRKPQGALLPKSGNDN